MNVIVLDCSVTMSWCFEDETGALTEAALDSLKDMRGVVPAIWPLEVANVLVVKERQRKLTHAKSAQFVSFLSALPISVDAAQFVRVFAQVLDLARQHNLSSYDASYLELAMRLGAPLASKDQGLRVAARKAGVELFGP